LTSVLLKFSKFERPNTTCIGPPNFKRFSFTITQLKKKEKNVIVLHKGRFCYGGFLDFWPFLAY
jgi:hypothetical protein